MKPKIVPRSEHGISRQNIDPDALKILYRLHRHGHKAYIVGGGVRDLMLGLRPKDFDIATDAQPGKLKKLFRNCRIIGRRFRLAHLHFPPNKVIEVATFRSTGESDQVERDGELIRRDNVFGTPSEDASRRDLTINGLFYSIADFSVIDYVGGVKDLRNRVIRMIGDPFRSFREDPVRILRAIRHATRIDFDIDEETEDAIQSERQELLKVNKSRLLEELYRDLCSGIARKFFESLDQRGLLDVLMPALVESFEDDDPREGRALLIESLDRLDRLWAEGQNVTHAIGLSALFAPLILPVARELCEPGANEPHPPYAPFKTALAAVFENLKVYRKDEERLWHALGAWPRLEKAFQRSSIPQTLSRRHYFPDAAEIFGLLEDETPELELFLDEARACPAPQEEAPAQRRPRRRRNRSKKNTTPTTATESTPAAKSGKKKRRRSRRRPSARTARGGGNRE